jgi:hypothetical protein
MSRGTKIALWSFGGCALLVTLLIVGSVVFTLVFASRAFNLSVGKTNAPADFPVYPGSRIQTGISMGAKDKGQNSIRLVQWSVPASGDTVTTWYVRELDKGDWAIDDHQAGAIDFHRRSTGAVAHLQVQGELAQSVVQLEMTGDQPLERGASPGPAGANPFGSPVP